MCYASGGDPEHDYLLSFYEQITEATATAKNVSVTALFYASQNGEEPQHQGTHRYYGNNGILKEDTSFSPSEDYNICTAENLADFINWSKRRYPNRHYIIIFGGHGSPWSIEYDMDDRSFLHSGDSWMTSSELAEGVAKSNTHFDALIMHSCMQGSIENLAEWENVANYLVSSAQPIPDLGYDYLNLVEDLAADVPLDDALCNMVQNSIDTWQSVNISKGDLVLTVLDMRKLSPLWNLLEETYSYMLENLDAISHGTDFPAVPNRPYWECYNNTLSYLISNHEFVVGNSHHYIDAFVFPQTATAFSCDHVLGSYSNKLNNLMFEDIILCHRQLSGNTNYVFNILANDDYFSGENLEKYRTTKFDQLTKWSYLREELVRRKNQ